MSFQYILSYRQNLINFLSFMNPNIDWNNTLNEIITYPIHKLLNRIRTYLWRDKDEDSDEELITENTYTYYMKLLCLIDSSIEGKTIYIIDKPKNESDMLVNNDVINQKVEIKVNVLKNILTFQRKEFKIINDNSTTLNSDCVVFPVCSVMYNKPNELINDKVSIVNDGYYNLFSSDQELEFNILRLLIVELYNNPSENIDELLKNKYGMLKVEKNQLINTFN